MSTERAAGRSHTLAGSVVDLGATLEVRESGRVSVIRRRPSVDVVRGSRMYYRTLRDGI